MPDRINRYTVFQIIENSRLSCNNAGVFSFHRLGCTINNLRERCNIIDKIRC
jgi:hypothetical protein